MVSRLHEIKPLREYLEDKKEMIEQMFLCVEDHQLKKMIPDCLKDAGIEDIKAECLVELLGMSKKRIIAILEGKELDESSEDSLELSDITDDDLPVKAVKKERKSPEKNKKKKDAKGLKSSKANKKSRKHSSSSEDVEEVDDSEEEKSPSPPPKKKKTKKKVEEAPKEAATKKTSKTTKNKKAVSVEKDKAPDLIIDPIDLGVEVPQPEKTGGKNLLELLELEMRARAIRSLIDREEKKKDEEPTTSNKEQEPEPEEEEDDDDPEAVIVVDEGLAEEIDLTKDSDEENKTNKEKLGQGGMQTEVEEEVEGNELETESVNASKEDSNAVKEKQIPNYRKHNEDDDDDDVIICEDVEIDEQNVAEKDKKTGEFIPRSWTERWLESDDVQKVMKTSKVLTNLKKRLITVNKNKSQEDKEPEEQAENVSVEGTVNEYSQLPTIRVYNNEDQIDPNAENPTYDTSETNLQPKPVIISAKPILYIGSIEANVEENIGKDTIEASGSSATMNYVINTSENSSNTATENSCTTGSENTISTSLENINTINSENISTNEEKNTIHVGENVNENSVKISNSFIDNRTEVSNLKDINIEVKNAEKTSQGFDVSTKLQEENIVANPKESNSIKESLHPNDMSEGDNNINSKSSLKDENETDISSQTDEKSTRKETENDCNPILAEKVTPRSKKTYDQNIDEPNKEENTYVFKSDVTSSLNTTDKSLGNVADKGITMNDLEKKEKRLLEEKESEELSEESLCRGEEAKDCEEDVKRNLDEQGKQKSNKTNEKDKDVGEAEVLANKEDEAESTEILKESKPVQRVLQKRGKRKLTK